MTDRPDYLTRPVLTPEEKEALLKVASDSVRHGLEHGRPLPIQLGRFSVVLQRPGACFVTLKRKGSLRGCIGSLQAERPLVEDASENAYAAAFRDPRFYSLQPNEAADLQIHVSVLTPRQPMKFSSEKDLLSQLQPGKDGLYLEDEFHRGTFLPSVWESLPEAEDFLKELKMKAGLPPDFWSPNLKVWRYEVVEIP